jgi:hypothetical protein
MFWTQTKMEGQNRVIIELIKATNIANTRIRR